MRCRTRQPYRARAGEADNEVSGRKCRRQALETHHPGHEPSRRDAVHADAEREKVVREELGKVAERGFRKEVGVRATACCRVLQRR